ncbi:MAG: biopolymer transporter ExbD [Bacteroidaceae bacterium]|nr:biopolymer transporter ExbD [Bacteroidaceae bacterium]MBR1467090.1 biopolymer transporter ExbD [Bacteroidaceae bacterium]
MAKKKKKMPGLNTSSTADISFMLLIFFLVTTSMDTDMGLARRLPQPPEDDQKDVEIDVKERNVFNVRINADGYLALYRNGNYDFIALEDLRAQAKEFIDNPHNLGSLPEKHVKDIELLGPMAVTDNHVISVQTDRGTPYNIYFQVQNELVAAYNELRDELSMARFHKPYAALDEERRVAIRAVYPQKISEAEPKKYGGN